MSKKDKKKAKKKDKTAEVSGNRVAETGWFHPMMGLMGMPVPKKVRKEFRRDRFKDARGKP